MDDDIPYSVSLNFYKLYSDVFNKTHNYIVNNLNTEHGISHHGISHHGISHHAIKYIYNEPTLSAQQYFNIMSFLEEIKL